jgi:hypothetical protein
MFQPPFMGEGRAAHLVIGKLDVAVNYFFEKFKRMVLWVS